MVARREQPLTGLRRTAAVFGVTLLAAALVFALVFRARQAAEFPAPRQTLGSPAVTAADFAGAESCRECHAAQYTAWSASTHGRAGGDPSPTLVLPAFDATPLRLANAIVIPRVRGGAYEFVVRQPGQPDVSLRVDGVIGGGHMYAGGTQAFVTRRDDGTWRVIPFEWSRHASAWFCNSNSRTGRGWTPLTARLRLEECGDWPPIRVLGDHPRYANCQSCHASQAVVAYDTSSRRYETTFTSLAINCEACHGPGRSHVELARNGRLGTSANIGLTSLAALDKDASLAVCYQCHAVKDQLRPGFLSGDTLSDYYSLKLPLLGERPLLPDGRIRTFAYQEGHQYSDCYLNGGMTCVSCHDPHSQGYRTVTGVPLPDRFDDRQCTSCHLSKAERPRAHTGHPESVSCVACHMPARQEPETRPLSAAYVSSRVVPYARSDHTISIPRPRLDSALGLASACAPCHATMTTAAQEQRMGEWWETMKPLPSILAAQTQVALISPSTETATRLLGSARDTSGNAYALFAGVSRYIDSYAVLDTELPDSAARRLSELASTPDLDVRAAALATLHLTGGSDRGTRRILARALRESGERDAALRSRWSVILGYVADQYAAKGQFAPASVVYRRALDIDPSSSRLWLALGNAQRNARSYAEARTSYQRSIELDSTAALPWVNLGIAATEQGDLAGATSALTQATAIDPNEPLAWFNLGNVRLLSGDVVGAKALYDRTIRLDPSIALGHFQLARLAMLAGDSLAALAHVRRGLAFDTTDAAARDFAAAMERQFAGRARPIR